MHNSKIEFKADYSSKTDNFLRHTSILEEIAVVYFFTSCRALYIIYSKNVGQLNTKLMTSVDLNLNLIKIKLVFFFAISAITFASGLH